MKVSAAGTNPSRMLRFKQPHYGRTYRFTIPHTGVTMSDSSMLGLYSKIRMHLDANGFDGAVITLDEIHEYNAKEFAKVDPDCCFETNPEPRHHTLDDVWRFTKTIFSNISSGSDRVDQDEANRRAAICAACPANVTPGNCLSCANSGKAAAIVGVFVGERKTPYDATLQACQFCGCFNKVQVWFPLTDLQYGMSQEIRDQLPSGCWKK